GVSRSGVNGTILIPKYQPRQERRRTGLRFLAESGSVPRYNLYGSLSSSRRSRTGTFLNPDDNCNYSENAARKRRVRRTWGKRPVVEEFSMSVPSNNDPPREEAGSASLDAGLRAAFGSAPTSAAPGVHLEEGSTLSRAVQPDPGPAPVPEVGGERAGRYQFLDEIGRGGMGAILRGHDLDLGRELALKVLLEDHCDNQA